MSEKSLKNKAIIIKNSQYVLVSDRIIYFNETYSNGSISTELVSDGQSDTFVVKATILPDCSKPERKFTGYSQAKIGDGMVNKSAALENAETSSVGRALAMLGIGVIDSVASVDEMNKAGVKRDPRVPEYDPVNKPDAFDTAMAKEKCKKCGGEMVRNPKTGNWFCKAKCWLKKEDDVYPPDDWN